MDVSHAQVLPIPFSSSQMFELQRLIQLEGLVLAASNNAEFVKFFECRQLGELRPPTPVELPLPVHNLVQIPVDSDPDAILFAFGHYKRRRSPTMCISLFELASHSLLHSPTISPLIDVQEGYNVPLALIPAPSSPTSSTFASPRRLIVFQNGDAIPFLDLTTRKIIAEIPNPPKCATLESFAGNLNHVVIGGLMLDPVAFGAWVFDVEKLVKIRSFRGGHSDHLTCLGYDPERRLLYTGGHDYQVCVWSYNSGEIVDSIDLEQTSLHRSNASTVTALGREPSYIGPGPSKLLYRPGLNALLVPLWEGSVFFFDARSSLSHGSRIPLCNRPLTDIVPRRHRPEETSFILSMDTEPPGGIVLRWKLSRGDLSCSKVVLWRHARPETEADRFGADASCLASLRCREDYLGSPVIEWERIVFALSLQPLGLLRTRGAQFQLLLCLCVGEGDS